MEIIRNNNRISVLRDNNISEFLLLPFDEKSFVALGGEWIFGRS